MKQRPPSGPAMQPILEKFPVLKTDFAELEARVMGSMVFADFETGAFQAANQKKEQKNDEA